MRIDTDGGTAEMFSPALLAAGCGALWCADYDYPLVVRVDPGTLTAEIWADFPAAGEPAGRDTGGPAGDGRNTGPAALATGLGAVWALPGDGARLLRIDPHSRAVTAHPLPFGVSEIAVGPDAVFALGESGAVLRFAPGSDPVTATPAGPALRLVAASGDYAWTVDDAAATVLALDGRSLAPVRTFRRPAAPDALCAQGSHAWYVSTAEVLLPPEDGRPQRAVRMGPGGFAVEVVLLDAATGQADVLGTVDGVAPQAALDGGRLWISGEQEWGEGEDPATALHCLGPDGRQLLVTALPGQIDALAAGDAAVWVAGFRASRQAPVLTALAPDGTVTGEVSFGHLDLSRWAPPPPPPPSPSLPLPQRARAVRDAVERALSEPRQAYGRFGDRWEAPPVSEEFQLDHVELLGPADAPRIGVVFRWAGEDGLFGLSYPIPAEHGDGAPDAYISVYVEEDLLASGQGIGNAVREPAGGVTWLRWPGR